MGDTEPQIISYRDELQPHFERLNRDWIEVHFTLEEADLNELRNPYGIFIVPGGQIFFIVDGEEVVGTCAVAPHPAHREEFHLSKMAVARTARGRGHGDRLMRAAIEFARDAGARSITLVSNRRLAPALTLYAKHGFREVPLDPDEQYARADIKMQLALSGDA